MTDLFKQRRAQHLTEMVKYLRYVFNDFFVIALLFLLGGLGWAYSNLLKQLHSGIWWAGLVVLIASMLLQSFNHLATLIQPADRVFLIPQEVAMHSYLKLALRYSLLFALLTQLIGWFLLLPWIQVTLNWNWLDLIGLLMVMGLLKGINLLLVFNRAYDRDTPRQLQVLGNGIILAVTIWLAPALGLLLSVVMLGWLLHRMRSWHHRSLDWQFLIEIETARMLALYKFFNLFTDVPNVQATNKRRRYLDWVVKRIDSQPANIYRYLYSRSIVRNGEYSGLHFRLTVIGSILLLGVGGTYLPILIGGLFIYLIGFQLTPFYFHFTDNVFTHIYPVDPKLQLVSFQRVITELLVISTGLFAVMTFIGSRSLWVGGASILVNLGLCWLLTMKWLPTKIKQKLN